MLSKTIPVVVLGLWIVSHLRLWHIHREIMNNGIVGIGKLVECKRLLYLGHIVIIPRYRPVIEFCYKDKLYKLRAMSTFHFQPGKIGDNLSIKFHADFPDDVVIIEKRYYVRYILNILFAVSIVIYFVCIL